MRNIVKWRAFLKTIIKIIIINNNISVGVDLQLSHGIQLASLKSGFD